MGRLRLAACLDGLLNPGAAPLFLAKALARLSRESRYRRKTQRHLRSTPSAPAMRSRVSIVGSRSRFSTRITIVLLSPARVDNWRRIDFPVIGRFFLSEGNRFDVMAGPHPPMRNSPCGPPPPHQLRCCQPPTGVAGATSIANCSPQRCQPRLENRYMATPGIVGANISTRGIVQTGEPSQPSFKFHMRTGLPALLRLSAPIRCREQI